MNKDEKPDRIEVRGARVHNLKNVSVDIPLNEIVGIATGSAVCRRITAISGISFHLYTAENDSGFKSRCGRGVVCSSSAGSASATSGSRYPFDFRYRNRTAQ